MNTLSPTFHFEFGPVAAISPAPSLRNGQSTNRCIHGMVKDGKAKERDRGIGQRSGRRALTGKATAPAY